MADQEIQSPYGSGRPLVLKGTDVPAVDGLKGQGDEPAFGRYATADGNRQINAGSKADLMAQIGAIRRNAQAAGGLRTAEVDSKAANERWAQFKAAYRNTSDSKPMSVIGEVMSDEIWETLGQSAPCLSN
jgi:hypothetical protein